MALSFPSIRCPSSRFYSPGVYPVRDFVAQNGAVVKVARGDRISSASLRLEYPYIANSEKDLVIALWNSSLGGFKSVNLPSNAFDGDAALGSTVPAYLEWSMKEPRIETPLGHPPGLSRMTLEFVGELLG
jgi:hypothetical protein